MRNTLILILGAVLAACGDDGERAVNLASVCPDPVVIQTDWNPESEYGAVYQLLGPDPRVDVAAGRARAALMDGSHPTGVDVEVRIGGPAIDFDTVTNVMYRDPNVLLGYVNTDEAIRYSASQPTIAVVAPLEISPHMLMWDPAAFPDLQTIAEMGQSDVRVLYAPGSGYMDYLLGTGILRADQVDASYDGTARQFLASGGRIAQQGFASAEPYIYEHEIEAWGRPVAFQLVHDTGYEIYSQPLAIRAADLATQRACLAALVPVIQRAEVAFLNDPERTNRLIVDLVRRYDNGWVYSEGVARFSVEQQRALGLVGNGNDQVLGNFDLARVQRVIDLLRPILAAQGVEIRSNLRSEDLVTNDLITPAVRLD